MPDKITESALLTRVDQELRAAQDYMGGKLSVQRRKALQYYLALPEGDLAPTEIEGRSSVVATDVADTVEWMLPSLLRIFTASDRVVQLNPRKPGMEQTAEDATDYLNWIFSVQNEGFKCLYTQFKDALISKAGILKVYWEDKIDEAREEYTGLSDAELAQLLEDKEVDPIEHESKPDEQDAKHRQQALEQLSQRLAQAMQAAQTGDPQAQQAAQTLQQQIQGIQSQPTVMLHDVTVKRTKQAAQVRIYPVPPEEFFISRAAKKISDAPFCAHVVERTVSDLRADGYSIEDDELPADDAGMVGRSMERATRWGYDDSTAPYPNMAEPPSDASMRRVWVVEAYLRADVDGDGIAEWRRVLKCGQKILDNVECDGPPFVAVTPIPLPHRFFGLSIADMAMESQKQKTAVMRAVLDNLYLQVNGRYFAVEGQVNLDDLLTSRPGGVVRVKNQGAVGPLNQGMADMRDAYQLMEYMEVQKENRTGFTRYSQGADSSSLNKTATGISIVTNRADMRVELIARVFAETGVKDLFVRMLELVCRYQQQPAEFRLNGRWLNINPREWRHQFDVTVNVGLGTNDAAQKISQIQQLMNVQKELAMAGTGIVGPKEAFHSASEMVKALGYKDAERFLSNPENAEQAPKQPDPEQARQQAEMQKEQMRIQADAQKFQAQTQLDQQRAQSEAQMAQGKAALDMQIEQQRMALEQEKIQAQQELDRWKAELDAQTRVAIAQIEAETTLEASRMAAESNVARDRAAQAIATLNQFGDI